MTALQVQSLHQHAALHAHGRRMSVLHDHCMAVTSMISRIPPLSRIPDAPYIAHGATTPWLQHLQASHPPFCGRPLFALYDRAGAMVCPPVKGALWLYRPEQDSIPLPWFYCHALQQQAPRTRHVSVMEVVLTHMEVVLTQGRLCSKQHGGMQVEVVRH